MIFLEVTKQILESYGIVPKKRLGQNFVIDEKVLDKMVSYACLSADDTVLEVGAGLGFLTERLAEDAGKVIAVEIDLKLVRALEDRLQHHTNVNIVQGDIFRVQIPPFDKVVSAPPYYISSQLLQWLLSKNFERAILILQEEFSRRLAASPGSDNYGEISILAYYCAEVKLLADVPREAFWPSPAVNSKIVLIDSRKTPFHVEDKTLFLEIVHEVFTQRNKKLRNSIMPFFRRVNLPKAEAIELAESLSFKEKRTRDLKPEEFGLVSNEILRKKHDLLTI